MAYQPKSYRKFIATAATATLVATAVAPVAGAASNFEDVATKYQGAVDYLVANGITQGTSATTFGTHDNVKRGDVAIWLAKALKLDLTSVPASGFSDTAGTRYDASVSALKAAGIISGKTETTFAPSAQLTRGEMAIILSKAYDLASDEKSPLTDAVGNYAQHVNGLYAYGVTTGKTSTTFAINENITRGDLAIFLKRAAEVVKTPSVVSVSAINLTQFTVAFNKEVDATTAEAKSNYTFDGSALASGDTVELSEDGKSVLVTLAAPVANQATKKVTVKNVKDADGATIEDFSADVKFADFKVPEVTSVVSAGPDSFKVTFNEPIDEATAETVANYSVNKGQYFIQSATKTGLNEVTVRLYSTLADGTYTVDVENVKDLAGFIIADTTLSLVQAADTTAPTVASVVSASPEKVVLEFNEDISLTDSSANLITADKVYHTNTNNTPDLIAVDPTNPKRLVLTFTTNKLPQGGTAYVVVEKEVVKDGWANKNAQYTANIPVTVDTVKPVVSKLESTSDKAFKLTFSEDVNATTAQNVANYTVLDSTGKKVDAALVSAVRDADKNNVVTLTLASALSGGVYTVVVENVKDLAANVIDKSSTSVAVKDSTAPTVTATGTLYADKKIVKVSFNEAMATSGAGSVLDLANYQFGGTYLNTTKATVTATDNGKAVLIDYSKTDLTIADGNTITVGKVADASGNFTTNFTSPVVVELADTVGISKVEAVNTKTVKVTLEDSLSKFEADDFVIAQGGVAIVPASVTFANVDGKGVITYTLTAGQELNTDATVAVTVGTAAAGINSENAFGVKVGASITPVAADDQIVAHVEKFDHDGNSATAEVADVQVSYTDTDLDGRIDKNETATFYVNYSEALDADTISRLGFEVAGFTVSSVALDGTDASLVVITASANADNSALTTTVKQVLDIADANDVVVKGGTSYTVAKEEATSSTANSDARSQAAVDAVAAGIASTLAANGAAGAVVLPAVPTGYTIAVKTTSTPAVYDADGKILTDGTSTVVYTVTHTASTNTADSGSVAVTVDVQ